MSLHNTNSDYFQVNKKIAARLDSDLQQIKAKKTDKVQPSEVCYFYFFLSFCIRTLSFNICIFVLYDKKGIFKRNACFCK